MVLKMSHKEYTFVTNSKGDTAIRIDDGDYKNVVLAFGKVGFNELEEECRLYFDYYLLENGDQVEDENKFKEVVGDILVDILENHPSEIGYGNDRDDHTSESDSE